MEVAQHAHLWELAHGSYPLDESGTVPDHDVFMPRILFLDLQEEDLRPIQIHGRSL